MNKNLVDRLLLILNVCLVVAAVLFMCLNFLVDSDKHTYLNVSLVCIMLFNVIDLIRRKKA